MFGRLHFGQKLLVSSERNEEDCWVLVLGFRGLGSRGLGFRGLGLRMRV